jgi:hypothetical protein
MNIVTQTDNFVKQVQVFLKQFGTLLDPSHEREVSSRESSINSKLLSKEAGREDTSHQRTCDETRRFCSSIVWTPVINSTDGTEKLARGSTLSTSASNPERDHHSKVTRQIYHPFPSRYKL